MKPDGLYLIRHGESEGNISKSLYHSVPDYAIRLTKKGQEQSVVAGAQLKELIKEESVGFYSSPYYRTRETVRGILGSFPNPSFVEEDIRLREHEWGMAGNGLDKIESFEKASRYGVTFYREIGGESGADTYDRISTFFIDLKEEFEDEAFPKNLVIVTHGYTMRVILMKLLRLKVEEFELLKTPKNCGFYALKLNANGRYNLINEAEKRPKLKRIW